jgi:hypothetical protein
MTRAKYGSLADARFPYGDLGRWTASLATSRLKPDECCRCGVRNQDKRCYPAMIEAQLAGRADGQLARPDPG